MRIEHVDARGDPVEIVTTGLRLQLSRGEITATARVPGQRELWRARPKEPSPERWRLEDEGPPVRLRLGSTTAEITEDGVIRLEGAAGWQVAPRFEPTSIAGSRGRWLLLDEQGGLAVQPEGHSRPERARWDRGGLALGAGRTWVGSFPPRRPTAEHLDWGIAHEGRPKPFPEAAYPSEEIVAESARTCRVFALHAYFWRAAPPELRPRFGRYAGRRCSWLTPRHEPEDPDRYWALHETVRRHGMRLVVYLSPYHCHAPDLDAEVERVIEDYAVDGLYLDGVSTDLAECYGIVRRIRERLGPDRILYLNATDQPLGSVRVFCPFIDAWADFVLRGDSGRGGLSRDRFLSEVATGWNLGNAVGVWCHYGSWGGPVPWDRVPPTRDIEAALSRHVRLWRRSFWRGSKERFDRVHGEGLKELAIRERASPR